MMRTPSEIGKAPPAEMAVLAITLRSGNVARLARSDGDRTTIFSPEPAPPGATVRGTVAGVSIEFQLKVRDCIKTGDVFVIDGRTQNATREMRRALQAAAQDPSTSA